MLAGGALTCCLIATCCLRSNLKNHAVVRASSDLWKECREGVDIAHLQGEISQSYITHRNLRKTSSKGSAPLVESIGFGLMTNLGKEVEDLELPTRDRRTHFCL